MGRKRLAITQEEAYARRKDRIFLEGDEALAWARAFLKRMKMVLTCNAQVRVTATIPLSEACADTAHTGKTYAIRVASGMTPMEIEDIVIHEFAHARAWSAIQAKSTPHDGHWGLEYSICYRAFHDAV